MVTFKELKEEIKTAMKEKDVLKKETFRMVVSKMEQERKEVYGKDSVEDLTAEDTLRAVKKFVKDLEKEKELYTKMGKDTQKVEAQIKMFDKFIPQAVSGEALKEKIFAMLEAKEQPVTMKVLGEIKKEIDFEVDFKEVQGLVKEFMSK